MASTLPLRAALKHGALITAANWPVVLIEFAIESLFKFALAVPVIGGALMVAVLVGDDLGTIFGQGVRAAADLVIGSLATAPGALTSFFAAVGLVAFGGGIVMFIVKGGTLAVIVESEHAAGDLHRGPVHLDALRRAYVYDLATILDATRRFARRSGLLAAGLSLSYLIIGWGYITALGVSFRIAETTTWASAWPLLVLVATSTSVIAVTAINLAFDLLRVIVITDDCRIRTAVRRLRAFLVADARQVLGIFGVVGLLVTRGDGGLGRHDGGPHVRRVGAVRLADRRAAAGRGVARPRPRVPVRRAHGPRGLPNAVPPIHRAGQPAAHDSTLGATRMTTSTRRSFPAPAQSLRESAIRKMGAVLAQAHDMISFAPGYPAEDVFAWEAFAEIARELLSGNDGSVLQYGPTRGYKPLRDAIVALMGERHITASAGRLVVTTGSQQGLDLIARVLFDPGDVVLVELPSYTGAISAFHGVGASLVGVRQEPTGSTSTSSTRHSCACAPRAAA